MKTVNVMIVGLGNHARRIYVPAVTRLEKVLPIRLAAGVELEGSQSVVEDYLQTAHPGLLMTYLKKFDAQKGLPTEIVLQLNEIVRSNSIDAVIISTDPLAHKIYALWGLSQGLHILMDKPISTREFVTKELSQAEGITEDFDEILAAYNELQKKKQTIFTVNTQRRFEAGFQEVFRLIEETTNRFGVPVTSIQSMHSDGVWIFPQEIVDQTCHPYNSGYGKCSHSGYHIFDISWQFYAAGMTKEKKATRAEVYTSFVQPGGLLQQVTSEDYATYFGPEYKSLQKYSDVELASLFENYGENDAFSIVKLLRAGVPICNISINLLHNGFSRRSWMLPAKDLYKGNGRVKHQTYHIQQGPFQCVQIHNYQANDVQDKSTLNDYELGGNNHFDIYLFRNSRMFGGNTKPLEVINLKSLDVNHNFDDSRIYQETAKDTVLIEFFGFILGTVDKADLKSNITSHEIPVKMMSSIYKSHIQYKNKQNPLISFEIPPHI